MVVLILVVMEDALVHEYDHYTQISFDEVLILVVMEDALVPVTAGSSLRI